MTHVANESNSSPWSRFRTRDPNTPRIFLDPGRAEVMFNMIALPELGIGESCRNFLEAAYVSSDGDPAALELLIEAFENWIEVDADFEALMRLYWRSRGMTLENAIASLRRTCTEQSIPLPPTMVHSIFDDLSFDFTAYLAWHNSGA